MNNKIWIFNHYSTEMFFDKDGRHIDAHREYRITHPLDLRNFVELNRYDLPLNERGTRWLDTLYANVLNKQIL